MCQLDTATPRCFYCKKEIAPAELTVEHVIPRSIHINSRSITVKACAPCNHMCGKRYCKVLDFASSFGILNKDRAHRKRVQTVAALYRMDSVEYLKLLHEALGKFDYNGFKFNQLVECRINPLHKKHPMPKLKARGVLGHIIQQLQQLDGIEKEEKIIV